MYVIIIMQFVIYSGNEICRNNAVESARECVNF